MTLKIVQIAIHLDIWQDIGGVSSPSQVWKSVEIIVSEHGRKFVQTKYWVHYYKRDEFESNEVIEDIPKEEDD